MSNRSTYNSKLLRAEPAAPAARSGVIGTVNPYWLQQAASPKRQASRLKRQAASRKRSSAQAICENKS